MRKFFGAALSVLALGSAAFFVMAVSDLLTGGSPETGAGVLAGLAVFFGGLTATTGVSAWKLLTSKGVAARQATPQRAADERSVQTEGIDIQLESQILALAAQETARGRVTVAEVATRCAVSLDQAERALDGLTQRGHADLHITDNGDRVYVVRGFLSAEEKQKAVDVVEATRT